MEYSLYTYILQTLYSLITNKLALLITHFTLFRVHFSVCKNHLVYAAYTYAKPLYKALLDILCNSVCNFSNIFFFI